MKIFLDFDDTLFDTRRFREGMKAVFSECGVGEEQFRASYEEIKRGFSDEKVRTYDFDRHVNVVCDRFGVNEADLRFRIDMFLQQSAGYFFSDTIPFVETLRKRGYHLCIVSYGTTQFQNKKIEASGMARYVDDIVVGDINKGEEIAKRLPKEAGWFLEDRAEHIESAKQANPHLSTILVSRPEGRYTDKKTKFCDYVARNLKTAEEIICENAL
jgi:phosphoglycolate phosphatase-like HAD superfamily hydrolase